jgi:hypothetical protein
MRYCKCPPPTNLRGLPAGGLRLFEGLVAANQRRIDNQLDARDRVVRGSAHAQILRLGEAEMHLGRTHAWAASTHEFTTNIESKNQALRSRKSRLKMNRMNAWNQELKCVSNAVAGCHAAKAGADQSVARTHTVKLARLGDHDARDGAGAHGFDLFGHQVNVARAATRCGADRKRSRRRRRQ